MISKYYKELKEVNNLIRDKYLKNIGTLYFVIDGNSICRGAGILSLVALIDFLSSRDYIIHIVFDVSFEQTFSQENRKILNKIANVEKNKVYIHISEDDTHKKILDLADGLIPNVYVITANNIKFGYDTKFRNYEVVLCEKIVNLGIKNIINSFIIEIEDLLIDIDLSDKTIQDFITFSNE